MLYFTIHNIFSFSVGGAVSARMEKFFVQELGYFQCEKREVDLEIQILPEIQEPDITFAGRYGKDKQYFYVRDPYSRIVGIFSQSKVIADSRVDAGWLLKDIVESFMLLHIVPKGYSFLHASAVEKNNKAIIFTALPQTGKTNFLISLLRKGYSFLSDEMVIISREGMAYPYPRPLSIYPYNFQANPGLIDIVSGNSFTRKQKIKLVLPLYAMQNWSFIKHPTSLALRVLQMFLRKAAFRYFLVGPESLGSTIGKPAIIEKIFLLFAQNTLQDPVLREVQNTKQFAEQLWTNIIAEKGHFFHETLDALSVGFPEKKAMLGDEYLQRGIEVLHEGCKNILCFELTISRELPFQDTFKKCESYFS